MRLVPNNNISFPIGTILAVQDYYERLGLSDVIGKHKKRGRDFNSLVKAMVSYKLTENQSVTKAADWINRQEVLNTFDLETFEQRTLYRVLEILGENREEIIADIQDVLFETYDFKHTNVNLDWTSIVLTDKNVRSVSTATAVTIDRTRNRSHSGSANSRTRSTSRLE